ncbi:MAG: hypothetical protein ABI970_00290, partial [Chloroflexota bacterium]
TEATAAYIVNLSTDPASAEANKPFTLTVTILNADGKTPVTAFDEVHTKLLHFIVVTQDLTQFQHVHPDYQGNGVFVLKNLVLPEAANYVTYADFTPTGEHQHYVRNTLTVNGAIDKQPGLVVSPTEVTIGGLKMSLSGTDAVTAGVETSLKFHVSDAKTGTDINNLDEYLGAAGHLVIIDEANQIYIHTHPAGHDMDAMSDMATATPEMAGMTMPIQYGPDLEFMTAFPNVGLWAMWLQVQYKGDVYTFPFVVDVTDNADVTPEATAAG